MVLARNKQKEKNDLLHAKKSQDLFCLREQQWIAHTAYMALKDDNDGNFDDATELHNEDTEEDPSTLSNAVLWLISAPIDAISQCL